jgi:peptide/nickel transport system permease protein
VDLKALGRAFARRNRLGLFGLVVLLAMVVAAAGAPVLVPASPTHIDMLHRFQPPSWQHPFGTDELGRDVFSRIVYGARVSLEVGLIATGIAMVAGVFLGVIAGYRAGSWTDNVIMRAMDVLLAFPAILLAIAIMATLGPSVRNVMIAIGIVNIPVFARIARASVMQVIPLAFVEAARAAGASWPRALRRDVVPNALSPIIVQASLTMASAILAEAALSYLGLGVQPPTPSWGGMLSTAQEYLTLAPWLAVFPGLAIFLSVFGLNLIGDGLRDALDPKARNPRAAMRAAERQSA